jgi:hypothetical protein
MELLLPVNGFCIGSRAAPARTGRKRFFFEKKKEKTFDSCCCGKGYSL